jgi:1,4-alpha-glucan branching enzyme
VANLNILDGWNRDSHEMKKNQFGVFEITVPAKDGQPAIPHDSKIKVREHPP